MSLTPGRWKAVIHGNESYPYPLSIESENGQFWVARDGTTSSIANAHLIAAAPELLEALVDLVEIDRRDELTDPDLTATDGHRERTWNKARAAIAKAKGATP